MPGRLWESVGAEVFSINNKHYLCIADYHITSLMIKQVEGFTTDNLIKSCKIFSENRLASKVVSDADTNFVSEKFQDFCRYLGIHHAVSSSYNYQSNGQEEACIKFIKKNQKFY